MATVDVRKVASALNLEKRRIQQLVNEGMPREARGQYDPVKCMLWYIRYLQRLLEKNSVPALEGGFVGERAERLRLLRADADLKEMELSRQRSQLVAIQDVEKTTNDLVRVTTAHIMAIAPRLVSELVGETSRVMIQAKIEKACRGALSILAKHGSEFTSEYPRAKSPRREALAP